jgi:hypothetical protein
MRLLFREKAGYQEHAANESHQHTERGYDDAVGSQLTHVGVGPHGQHEQPAGKGHRTAADRSHQSQTRCDDFS